MDKHLTRVRKVIWDIRAKWLDLGVGLGINIGTLEVGHLHPIMTDRQMITSGPLLIIVDKAT